MKASDLTGVGLPLDRSLIEKVNALPGTELRALLSKLPDEIVADLVRQGDDEVAESAFEALEFRYRAPTKRYVSRGAAADYVDDINQETWISLWVELRNKQSFDPRLKFTSWMYSIARRRRIDWWRRNGPWVVGEDPIEDHQQRLESLAGDDSELWAEFHRALSHLSDERQLLLRLKYEEEFTIQEIADKMKMTIPTMMTKLRRAETLLRKYWFGEDDSETLNVKEEKGGMGQ